MQVGAGVGAIVTRDYKLLVGCRAGAHEPGTWAVPGGWIERYEEPTDAVVREVFEETGVKVCDPVFELWTNDPMPAAGQHCITLFYACQYVSGEPRVSEPDKFTDVGWMSCEELVRLPLFTPTAHFLRTHRHYGLRAWLGKLTPENS